MTDSLCICDESDADIIFDNDCPQHGMSDQRIEKLVVLLNACAKGREEYAQTATGWNYDQLMSEAGAYRGAAQIVGSDDPSEALRLIIPSWRWAALGIGVAPDRNAVTWQDIAASLTRKP